MDSRQPRVRPAHPRSIRPARQTPVGCTAPTCPAGAGRTSSWARPARHGATAERCPDRWRPASSQAVVEWPERQDIADCAGGTAPCRSHRASKHEQPSPRALMAPELNRARMRSVRCPCPSARLCTRPGWAVTRSDAMFPGRDHRSAAGPGKPRQGRRSADQARRGAVPAPPGPA
jgi:hypothetical protein